MTQVNELLIGIDVGGTFTDAIVFDTREGTLLAAFKIASSPSDPGQAVVAAIEKISQTVDVRGAVVCHGTTVGTNTLIERKGSRTALLTTSGFTDVVELRRQDRPKLYGFDVRISEPLAPRELRYAVEERVAADGEIVRPLQDVTELIGRVRKSGASAVAICLLHSYANGAHEQELADAVAAAWPEAYVSRSSDICPEFGEYERSSTTLVNAYIGQAVSGYVSSLDRNLRDKGIKRFLIVKSNGGLTSPENAARYPVHLIESGPAAQLTATAAFARATGRPNLIAFDMGGTTAKAGVIRGGQPEMTSEFYADRLVDGLEVGGYAIRSSVLDLVEIGAGGGSIAFIDEANVLKVGPRSAGANPGPACYSRGGDLPTVTDAHAVIGTLNAELFADSGVRFDRAAAVDAIKRHIADPLGWSVVRAAYSIIDIAVANMAEMVRLATTHRGLDPRDFSLLASGGAGPLHATAVGHEIGAREVLIPPFPGMFSALGATLGPVRHEVTQTVFRDLKSFDPGQLKDIFAQLSVRADKILSAEPQGAARPSPERIAEARFAGQLFQLKVPLGCEGEPLPAIEEIERRFRDSYRNEYGFELPDARVQIVNCRLIASIDLGYRGDHLFAPGERRSGGAKPSRRVAFLTRDGDEVAMPVYRVADALGCSLTGPGIIEHSGSTVWIHGEQVAQIGASGQVTVALTGGSR
ncbi:MAG TPA: hydantoinase/oxoprolinase family protein [Bradyrhizobium sp.]|nr:hydantoinase/oxoprolinase family protein [Bradyrhizobium sp.]